MQDSQKPIFSLSQFKILLRSQFPGEFNNRALSIIKKMLSLANIKRKKRAIVLYKPNTQDIKDERKILAYKITSIINNNRKNYLYC